MWLNRRVAGESGHKKLTRLDEIVDRVNKSVPGTDVYKRGLQEFRSIRSHVPLPDLVGWCSVEVTDSRRGFTFESRGKLEIANPTQLIDGVFSI